MSKFSEAIANMKRRDPELGDKDRSNGLDEGTHAQRDGAPVKRKPVPPGGRGRRNPTYGKRHGNKKLRGRDLASKL